MKYKFYGFGNHPIAINCEKRNFVTYGPLVLCVYKFLLTFLIGEMSGFGHSHGWYNVQVEIRAGHALILYDTPTAPDSAHQNHALKSKWRVARIVVVKVDVRENADRYHIPILVPEPQFPISDSGFF